MSGKRPQAARSEAKPSEDRTGSTPLPVEPGTTRLGWIGLGVMGTPMCAHLVRAGYAMSVFTRTRARAEPQLAAGARWADTPRALAAASDVVFTMLGFPRDVREVVLGADGVLAGLRAGAILVDMTTSEPALGRARSRRRRARAAPGRSTRRCPAATSERARRACRSW